MKRLILILTFVLASCEVEARKPNPHLANKERCVKICVADYLGDMHNNGKSWGTGSSSLPMGQDNTLKYVRDMCLEIYEFECYAGVVNSDWNYLHNDSIYGAGVSDE